MALAALTWRSAAPHAQRLVEHLRSRARSGTSSTSGKGSGGGGPEQQDQQQGQPDGAIEATAHAIVAAAEEEGAVEAAAPGGIHPVGSIVGLPDMTANLKAKVSGVCIAQQLCAPARAAGLGWHGAVAGGAVMRAAAGRVAARGPLQTDWSRLGSLQNTLVWSSLDCDPLQTHWSGFGSLQHPLVGSGLVWPPSTFCQTWGGASASDLPPAQAEASSSAWLPLRIASLPASPQPHTHPAVPSAPSHHPSHGHRLPPCAVSDEQQADPRLMARVYDDMAARFGEHGLNLPAVQAMCQYFDLSGSWLAGWLAGVQGGRMGGKTGLPAHVTVCWSCSAPERRHIPPLSLSPLLSPLLAPYNSCLLPSSCFPPCRRPPAAELRQVPPPPPARRGELWGGRTQRRYSRGGAGATGWSGASAAGGWGGWVGGSSMPDVGLHPPTRWACYAAWPALPPACLPAPASHPAHPAALQPTLPPPSMPPRPPCRCGWA